MIVNRKMAEEAMARLEIVGIDLDQLTIEWVKGAYRVAVQYSHPDKGGSVEDFAAVDRAKHVLLEWLGKEQPARPVHKPDVCPRCDGRGFVAQQRAWRAMRMQCPRCRGAGDLDTEHEESQG